MKTIFLKWRISKKKINREIKKKKLDKKSTKN